MRSLITPLMRAIGIGAIAAFAATSTVCADPRGPDVSPQAGTDRAAKTSTQSAPEPRANPLWNLPLSALNATRERPLFTPSRRPPPPPAANVARVALPPAPPPPPAPEKPQLSLLGTVAGEGGERIGVFLDPAVKTALRLKLGEDHKGWVLRGVEARKVTLAKGMQTEVLSLPAPEMHSAAPAQPGSQPAALAPSAVVAAAGTPSNWVPKPGPYDASPQTTRGPAPQSQAGAAPSPWVPKPGSYDASPQTARGPAPQPQTGAAPSAWVPKPGPYDPSPQTVRAGAGSPADQRVAR